VSCIRYRDFCKALGVKKGMCMEFNYREFLKILDVLFTTGQMKRNY